MARFKIAEAEASELVTKRASKWDESEFNEPVVNSWNEGTPFAVDPVKTSEVDEVTRELHAVAKRNDVSVRVVVKDNEDGKTVRLVVQARDRIQRPRSADEAADEADTEDSAEA